MKIKYIQREINLLVDRAIEVLKIKAPIFGWDDSWLDEMSFHSFEDDAICLSVYRQGDTDYHTVDQEDLDASDDALVIKFKELKAKNDRIKAERKAAERKGIEERQYQQYLMLKDKFEVKQ